MDIEYIFNDPKLREEIIENLQNIEQFKKDLCNILNSKKDPNELIKTKKITKEQYETFFKYFNIYDIINDNPECKQINPKLFYNNLVKLYQIYDNE